MFNSGCNYEILGYYNRNSLQEKLRELWKQFIKENASKYDDVKAMLTYKNILLGISEILKFKLVWIDEWRLKDEKAGFLAFICLALARLT